MYCPDKNIELVPRVGDHVIYLGKLDDFEQKLKRVKVFYEKGLNKVGWNKYSRISVEFDNQIICTKKRHSYRAANSRTVNSKIVNKTDMATTDFIAAIELSSSKISGIAGKKNSDGSIQVLAYAREDASSFIHKGVIYNIDKAAQALTSITNKLENQLNNSIAKVYVGIGGQSLRTVKNAVSRTLEEEGIISQELVDAICDENLEVPLADMSVLDVAPQEYKIDNTLQADPVGVAGQHITGQFLNIVARASLKKNLEHSFEQAKVEIADLLIAPIALANAVLTENEMRSGCALVDFGADTTTISVYKNNILRYLSVLAAGWQHHYP